MIYANVRIRVHHFVVVDASAIADLGAIVEDGGVNQVTSKLSM